MERCEWKDGKFEPCKRFNGKVSTSGYYDYVGEKGVYKFSCDSCGADIQKPEPEVIPTHEEILKPRFWQMDNPNYWRSITGFRMKDGISQYLLYDGWCESDFFINRESADIPPEAK